MGKNPKVFISYSWDCEEHKDWVVYLMNKLRENGIDAKIDRSETQKHTVNLYQMMIENVMNNDYVIVVMTEKYAERANGYKGGVGFETMLIGNEILENKGKIIPIKKSKLSDKDVIPFYLKGFNYTDFSNSSVFNISLEELLHRIYEVDQIEIVPLGKRPELKPRKVDIIPGIQSLGKGMDFDNIIPNLRNITDIDKMNYIRNALETIRSGLVELSENTKQNYGSFTYYLDETNNKDFTLRVYLNGMEKRAVRIWRNNAMSRGVENIFISYDATTFGSGTSFNNMITCDVVKNELHLDMMVMWGDKPENVHDIIEYIWKEICNYLK